MWMLTETTFEYDDERYRTHGGYHAQKVYRSKEAAQKEMDDLNIDWVREIGLSSYYEYEWPSIRRAFFSLWEKHAAAIEVHEEFELPVGEDGRVWEYDKMFNVLMNILPREELVEFINKHLSIVGFGIQEVKVVE